MKYLLLFALFLATAFVVTGQHTVLTIKQKNVPDSSVTLLLLQGDRHYADPAIIIKRNQHGIFTTRVKLAVPTFALLKTTEDEYRILLIPREELIVSIDTGKQNKPRFSGSPGKANELLGTIRIGTIPFFGVGDPLKNSYAKLSPDSLDRFVYKAGLTEIAAAENTINKSSIDPALKKLIRSEYKYYYQAHLVDFAKNYLRWAKNPAETVFRNKLMESIAIPDSITLINGFYANMILSELIQERMQKPQRAMPKPTPEQKETLSQELFGMKFDDVKSQAEQYGERYMLSWLYANKHLPQSIRDKIIFNKVLDAYNDGSIGTALVLYDTLQRYYPASSYLAGAANITQSINRTLQHQFSNQAIRLHENNTDTSFAALLKPYAGKLVYVDIWGTWCGPCKIEMKYVPELKKKFKEKNIAFVYLDMDEKGKHEKWKEYVRYYGIEGEHFRFDQQQIQSFWKEVEAAGGTTHSYPAYLIFDQHGRMVNAKAARPSSKQELYDQLEKLL